MAEAPTKFYPKQCVPRDAKLYETIGGRATQTVADFIFTKLPPLPPNSTIHDSACGQAFITGSAVKACPPASLPTLRIEATDIKPGMIFMASQDIKENNWPATSTIMDSTKLDFPDEKFTHSIMSFGLPIMPDPAVAAAEMYRTLKPGGIAVTAFWTQIPAGETIMKANQILRPANRPLAMVPKPGFKDPENLRRQLASGGFEIEKIKLEEFRSSMIVKDVKYFIEALWGSIGETADGWHKEDEDEWDHCVEVATKCLREHPGYVELEDGTVKIHLIAAVAIGTK
jgi:ubiquinone/menaquinone biosynthesis C-methylase UbiE